MEQSVAHSLEALYERLLEWRGRRFPAFTWVVEPGKVAEFARAVTLDRTGLTADTTRLPLTFSETARMWQPHPDLVDALGLDRRFALHGRQQVEFFAAPAIGEQFEVRSMVEDVRLKRGRRSGQMLVVTLRTEFWAVRQGVEVEVQRTRRVVIQTAGTVQP